jgi:hypothetical protein
MTDKKKQESNCKSFGHVLDFSTLQVTKGIGCSPRECVVDVWCKVCGASGSATVYADDVMFDDDYEES